MLILIVLNLMQHKNKQESLPIKNQKKVRHFFWKIVDICLYSFIKNVLVVINCEHKT